MSLFLGIFFGLVIIFLIWAVVSGLLETIEAMIVFVIIGLLAAMAIPAYQKVKETSIGKAIQSGSNVSKEDLQWYREKTAGQTSAAKAPTEKPTESSGPQSIVLDGKRFYLIDKVATEETRINGKTYWLVPANP